ncbi:Gfo/Idh/MocA family oxidoreductase [Halobacillus litoralis]|uniref:Gfo/Idh/MocA family protein n=1 Tax=Halobacillus litoralis TaxID=45668 RepID=UPI001CD73C39|nr:Gfo/Idh/MocA family oxidoreductase [Halobacillus litoralis]MCA0970497.1 Gfo/Idh/MocA family oxidoreductase [Halobacillus litoralis]
METIKVGVVGCGNISDIYFQNLSEFDKVDVFACADLKEELALEKAERYQIPNALSVPELLEHPEIELVINLTPPKVHADLSIRALENDKHVYSEKPLAVTKEDGLRILEKANEKGRMAGSAPDTFLGGGLQTCQDLVQSGAIGDPVAATAFMMSSGPEQWHPNPDFFYQEGAGPLMDMGPYYLTALIQMLGPIEAISASASTHYPERVIQSGERKGEVIKVETPTHFSGNLTFKSGVEGVMMMSFDIAAPHPPSIVIYGTEGTLRVPDPNHFGGPIFLQRKGEVDWTEVDIRYSYVENSRGIGVLDMVTSIQEGTPFRANGQLAFHVLDAMKAFYESSDQGERVRLGSTCAPSPLLEESLQKTRG